jgi:hypothetical protein
MVGICESCGAVGPVHRHHPSGRMAGIPCHPRLTEALCPECHGTLHALWHHARLEADGEPDAILLLRRLACWCGRRTAPLDPDRLHALGDALDELVGRLLEEASCR